MLGVENFKTTYVSSKTKNWFFGRVLYYNFRLMQGLTATFAL